MQFEVNKAPSGVDREKFVQALEKRGLKEVDIPRSTGLLNELPIFSHTHEAIPRYGSKPWHDFQPNELFPGAMAFFHGAIKLPMWATPTDYPIVDHYGNTFVEVAEEMMGCKLGRGEPVELTRSQRRESTQTMMMASAKL